MRDHEQAKKLDQILAIWEAGSEDTYNELITLVYDELRKLARAHLRKERANHTLRTEALVNEVYIRLQGANDLKFTDRAHFFGIASNAMKQVLVDYAREQATEKRGGRCDRVHVEDLDGVPTGEDLEILQLNSAIEELATVDKHKAAIVVMRYFGGLTIEDVASVLDSSPASVKREFASARSRLQRIMRGLPRIKN